MQITSKDLRIKAKTALDAVRRGEKVEITFHGKVIALMVSPGQSKSKTTPESSLPGFGMWKDNSATENTEQYVRDLRKPRYKL